MKIDLSGKIALVTGGSGNLGRVMVRTLAECGADVAIHYHQNKAKADELHAELTQMGVRSLAVQADVTDQDSILRMRDTVNEQLGAPDIIVNNAVIQYPDWTTILQQSPEDFESQFRSCVMHNVFMAKDFVPAMMEKRWGRVIGINTECSMLTYACQGAYSSAKRGMDGLMRVLAKEIGEYQITVNQVAPGWTISDRTREFTEIDDEYIRTVPLKRRGTDQEIANAVAFLASDLASFITGAYIPVAGGNVMPTI